MTAAAIPGAMVVMVFHFCLDRPSRSQNLSQLLTRPTLHEVDNNVGTKHVLLVGIVALDADGELGVRDLARKIDGLSNLVRAWSDRALDCGVGITAEQWRESVTLALL